MFIDKNIKQKLIEREELIQELKICKAELAVLKEEKVKRRTAEDRLYFLNEIFQAALSADGMFEPLRITLQMICEKTKCVFGQVWIPQGKNLRLSPAWYGEVKDLHILRRYSRETELKTYSGFLRKSWKTKNPVWIENILHEKDFPRLTVVEKVGIKAAIAIPIIFEDEVVAVMELFMLEEQQKDIGLLGFILAIAAQLGVLFKNKKSYTLGYSKTVRHIA